MENYKRFSGGNSRSGGGGGGGGFNRGGFGGRNSGGGGGRRDGGSQEMHRATCAECGNSCEVPFKPTGERPVYCSNCFGGKRGDSAPNSAPRREFAPRTSPSFPSADGRIDELKRQIEFVQQKLDKIFTIVDTFVKKQQEKEAEGTRKPMATPEFYKAIEKIEAKTDTKKKSSGKKVASKKAK